VLHAPPSLLPFDKPPYINSNCRVMDTIPSWKLHRASERACRGIFGANSLHR
jgi:hypothetical protein